MIQDEIMKLQTYKMFVGDDTVYVDRDAVLKLLEQEPCEDAISRQAVIDALTKTSGIRGDALKALYDLSPVKVVTPQPKIGHWITLKDEYGDIHEAVCSCCDKNGNHKWTYCPNCGTRMEVEDNG